MSAVKLAIDFDGLHTNIYRQGNGLVLSEPTVAAVSSVGKGEIKAVGYDAKKLIGKTAENTKVVFPVFEGEIVNETVAVGLLNAFLKKIEAADRSGVQAIFSVPCGATAGMLDKYNSVAKKCGIKKVYFAEAPILSMIGQRIALSESSPCFLIDMAGGTTNVAALSLDGIITGLSINLGVNKINTDIIDFISETYDLQIGLLSAEKLRKEIGTLEENDGLSAVINGRDLNSGKPKALSLKAYEIIEPVKKYYDKIAELAFAVMVKLPPEVSAEIRRTGIYVSGEGASVYGLKEYYSEKFNMKINIAENCSTCVALGGGIVMGNGSMLKKVSIKTV